MDQKLSEINPSFLEPMTKEKALALFAKGKNAWNAWAKTMLEERTKLELAGLWQIEKNSKGQVFAKNRTTQRWISAVNIDFSTHTFTENINFSGFVFPGIATFNHVIFEGEAIFTEVAFNGEARFQHAKFSEKATFTKAAFFDNASFDYARFENECLFDQAQFTQIAWFEQTSFAGDAIFSDAVFRARAWFRETQFKKDVWFSKTRFNGQAFFAQTQFKGFTVFSKAQFYKSAIFRALAVESIFLIDYARFAEVPDFIQAQFTEAPVLDAMKINPRKVTQKTSEQLRLKSATEANFWRALKRLAIQGHDHDRELYFFAGELKARRGAEDRIWHLRYWFGYFYQIFSNFGRSISRPLIWWGISTGLFYHSLLE